jgi:predicted acylesterase/phospholipase RssA
MNYKKFPKRPFQKIALSFSGGGYRATGFHLGAMSYLNRTQYQGKPLLLNVEMISTVSGGTLTGIVYALKTVQGASFEEFYAFLLERLTSEDLVREGISMLNNDAQWNNEHKTKNLINAFAELYNKKFTDGKVLKDLISDNSHLKNFVFNSTEFNNGINFRFKNPDNTKDKNYSGNFYNRVPNEISSFIKLGDIMAASSCFPGGFEPILWPKDFVYNGGDIIMNAKTANSLDTGLMDGGIYDNQGIESILNYKKHKAPYFDLVIISDVASPFMEPYKAVDESSKPVLKKLTIKAVSSKIKALSKTVDRALIFLMVLFLALPLLSNYANTIWTGICITSAIFMLGTFIIKRIITVKIKNERKQAFDWFNEKIPPFYIEKLSNLKIEEMSVARLLPLLLNRLNSLVSLLMDVFLKITRRLNYDKLYADERYTFRRISNLVKELTVYDFNMRLNREGKIDKASENPNSLLTNNYDETVGREISKVVEEASGFGTTLWFTDKEKTDGMLNKLVATGQMTMCYNLIKYIEKIKYEKDNMFSALQPEVRKELDEMLRLCERDWLQFKENPFIMTNKLNF